MTSSPLDDPDFFPAKLDLPGGRLLFVRLSARQRAEAAFLDERAISQQAEGFWLPLGELPTSRAEAQLPPHFIFHIGHCGSTLLSRVLQCWPELQVLREPLPLRTLAAALEEAQRSSPDTAQLLDWLLQKWATPQPPHQRVLIKATSSCNGVVAPILAMLPESRAVLLDMPLEPYLATVFKSPAAIRDALAAAPSRLAALAAVVDESCSTGVPLASSEVCAMGWLAEQVRFEHLNRSPFRTRILRVDFHEVLGNPRSTLATIADHFRLPASALGTALNSPDWTRYSKQRDHAYGVDDRQHDLALARQRFGEQIDAGRRSVVKALERISGVDTARLRLD